MVYETGTIRITGGSATIIGIGTAFVANVPLRAMLTIPNFMGAVQIARIVSDTEIHLARPVPGLQTAAVLTTPYKISADFTPTFNIPFPNRGETDNASLTNRALKILDGLLPNG